MNFQLESIQWMDHYSSPGWQEYPNTDVVEDLVATTVGHVLGENKKYLIVAQTVASHACAEVMYILKTDIVKRSKVNGQGRSTKGT